MHASELISFLLSPVTGIVENDKPPHPIFVHNGYYNNKHQNLQGISACLTLNFGEEFDILKND